MPERPAERLGLPDFGGKEAGESRLAGDSGESGLCEWCCVVGEVGGAEAGEDAEGQVEAADEESGWKMHWAGGYLEVGDNPEGPGTCVFCDAGDEGIEFGLGEAVEEEVGDDEIVGALEWEGQGVCLVDVEARFGMGYSFAALAKELKHGGAGVDCVGVEVRVLCKELGKEAAVSVA